MIKESDTVLQRYGAIYREMHLNPDYENVVNAYTNSMDIPDWQAVIENSVPVLFDLIPTYEYAYNGGINMGR